MDEYFAARKQYANFNGRAGRKEYWRFSLVQIGIACALAVWLVAKFPAQLDGVNSLRDLHWRDLVAARLPFAVMVLFVLATFLPTCAISVRRLHDSGYSGWWLLLGLIPYAGEPILFVLLCLKGTAGDNRFGAEPDEYVD